MWISVTLQADADKAEALSDALMEAGALYSVGQTGAVALREEFHDDRTGVLRQGNNMPFLAFEGGERH